MCTVNLLENDPLLISGRKFSSRLMLGTGKYANFQEAKDSILLSGCEILTVAVRRAQNSNVEGIDRLLNNLDWTKNLVNAKYCRVSNI
jgi:thiazole synthase